MKSGLPGHRKRNSSSSSTFSEFISGIIRDAVPVGNYQGHLATTAVSIISSQDELTLHFLPSISCGSLGGNPDKAVPITAAWQFIRLAAKLLDDVEDGEIRDHGAQTTNMGAGYLFAAYSALEKLAESGFSYEHVNRVIKRFNQACLHTCAGQDTDLTFRWGQIVPTPDDWLEVAQAKSGMLFAWASWAGAVAAGADEELQDVLWKYGLQLGILVQIADDYNGIWSTTVKTDLSGNGVTLPLSYAYFVSSKDEREILLNLLQEANLGNTEAISKARDLLSTLDAQRFILAAAQVQRCRAIETIRKPGLSRLDSQKLIILLNKVFPALVHLSTIPNETNSLH